MFCASVCQGLCWWRNSGSLKGFVRSVLSLHACLILLGDLSLASTKPITTVAANTHALEILRVPFLRHGMGF